MNSIWLFSLFLAVPILVHLFNFRKAKKYYFSSIRFISRLSTKSKSQSKIRRYLILFNRLLIFLSLIVLIWIFVSNRNNDSLAKGASILYFDNSLSAELSGGNQVMEPLVDHLLSSGDESVIYFDNDDQVLIDDISDLGGLNERSNYQLSPTQLEQKIESNESASVVVFSDFQHRNLSDLKNSFNDSTKKYQLLFSKDLNKVSNVAIDTLYIKHAIDNVSNLTVVVRFNVFNMDEGSVIIKLMQNNRQLSSVVKDVSELKDVLELDIPQSDWSNYEIVIDGDETNFDNVFHFSIQGIVKPRISVIDEHGAEFIREVYHNAGLFDVDYQVLGNWDYATMKKADLVVLKGYSDNLSSFVSQLSDAVFLLFPTDSTEVPDYREVLNLALSPARFTLREIDFDYYHPLLKNIFAKKVDKGKLLSVYPAFEVGGGYEPIIRFRGGSPFLLRKGNMYFFNSFFEKNTAFESNVLFLPILYQIAFSSVNGWDRLYYYPGEIVVLDGVDSEYPIKIKGNAVEVIPVFNRSGRSFTFRVPDELLPGNYVLMQGEDSIRNFAVNTPKEESVMVSPTYDELKGVFSTKKYVTVLDLEDGEFDLALRNGSQSSLWKYALILVMILIFIETLLHRKLK